MLKSISTQCTIELAWRSFEWNNKVYKEYRQNERKQNGFREYPLWISLQFRASVPIFPIPEENDTGKILPIGHYQLTKFFQYAFRFDNDTNEIETKAQ